MSQIITNVVRGLAANPKRKFSYVEQAFFQVWFETQGADVQATTKQLVACTSAPCVSNQTWKKACST